MIVGIDEIKNVISNVLLKFNISDDVELRYSNLKDVDIQCNNLLRVDQTIVTNDLKQEIIKSLKQLEEVKSVEILENNFINIDLSENYLDNYASIEEKYLTSKKPYSVLLDYGGPNIGKDLHVGHIRTLNIGRSLYNIYKIAGHEVVSDIHFGDWGMPVALIIAFTEKNNINIEELRFNDFENIYPKAASLSKEDTDFYEKSKNISKKLNDKDKFYISEWKKIYNIVIPEIKDLLKLTNHEFDFYLGESDVVNNIDIVLDKAIKEKKIKKDEGAYISTEKTDPPILITKSDGSNLYLTTDLGTVHYRENKFKIDKYIYVVDQRQQKHFEQLFSTCKHFELSKKYFEHVGFGTINGLDGKPFKTREGQIYKLRTLYSDIKSKLQEQKNNTNNVDILVNTVLTFSDLLPNRNQNYIFDVDKFTDINGKTGVYIQYSQVRAKKLLQNSNKASSELSLTNLNEEEKNLLFLISKFYYYFYLSLENNEPHHLAEYAYNLSQAFNSFYSNYRIFSSEVRDELRLSRLEIVYRYFKTIEITLKCLGINLVDEM